jgi:hypothetical protein
MNNYPDTLAPNCPTVYEHAVGLNKAYNLIHATTGRGYKALDIEQRGRRMVAEHMDTYGEDGRPSDSLRQVVVDTAQAYADIFSQIRQSSVEIIDNGYKLESIHMGAIEHHTAFHRTHGDCESTSTSTYTRAMASDRIEPIGRAALSQLKRIVWPRRNP